MVLKKLIGTIATLIITLGGVSCRRESQPETTIPARRQQQSALQWVSKDEIFPEKIIIQLRQNLYHSADKDQLPGVGLAIATSDGTWMEAAGWADVEKKKFLLPTDRFRIASLTKMFVAVVCLQLAEEGKLDLSDPIADWLAPDISDRFPNSDKITIRQLLNHTSGLPDPYDAVFRQAVVSNPSYGWQLQDVLSYAEGKSPASPRGSFFYSNTNYLLLELIIEQVTDHSLAKEIRQRILTPLQLDNTFMERREAIPGEFIQGYEDWDGDGKVDNVTQPLVNDGLGLGDGGLVSNATDLTQFMRALFSGGKLLRPETLKQMMTFVESDRQGGYGLGLRYVPTAWGEAWGHSGKTTGFMSDLLYLPAHDMVIVAWMNRGDSKRTPLEVIQDSLRVILGESRD